jgi:hypothetical protein
MAGSDNDAATDAPACRIPRRVKLPLDIFPLPVAERFSDYYRTPFNVNAN